LWARVRELERKTGADISGGSIDESSNCVVLYLRVMDPEVIAKMRAEVGPDVGLYYGDSRPTKESF
jgi:hypothetical protein